MEKLLFTELRVLKSNVANSEKVNVSTISRKGLELAFIDQENLKALGYKLKEDGVIRLAEEYSVENSEMTPLYKKVQEFEPGIEVSPMYPNFPIQVLEMSELEFRTNQLLHYMTTYGMETLLGMEVKKGWNPETPELMERKEDIKLVKTKVVDYLTAREVNEFVISNLIGKKERLTPQELIIAKAVVSDNNRMMITEIPFKENIGAIYGEILLKSKEDDLVKMYVSFSELRKILKHPGDVLDLVETLVVQNKYKHFRTALKRGLVEILESFPYAAIEENLASNRWSNKFLGKKGKRRSVNRNIALIDYLSFSRFSKKPEVLTLVDKLKDGELISWGQAVEVAYKNKDYEEVLNLLRQRPGVYFRQVNRLYTLGVDPEVISSDVKNFGHELKTQTIVSALNNFNKDIEVSKIFYDALIANLGSKNLEEIANKKVYIDSSEFDFSESRITILDKSSEGGYIQNGLAIKIPDEAKFVRFFTYWNDKRRVDIDLHSSFVTKEGEHGHVGWNGAYNKKGVVHSGDITHSNAAEYVDVDLDTASKGEISRLQFNINSFTLQTFKDIETVFTGLMLMSKMGEKVKLYDGKNVLFRHDLNGDYEAVNYAFLDVQSRLIYILGESSNVRNDFNLADEIDIKLTIQNYLDVLLASQGATIVEDKESADVILGLPKSDEANYYSLIDENYFMGAE